eukprot:1896276-Amphidinium_carterae.1
MKRVVQGLQIEQCSTSFMFMRGFLGLVCGLPCRDMLCEVAKLPTLAHDALAVPYDLPSTHIASKRCVN